MTDPETYPVLSSTRFKILPADVTAAQRKHMRWRWGRPRTWAFLLGWALLCAIVVGATVSWSPFVMAAGAAGALLWMIAWSVIVYVAMPLNARRAMTSQLNLRHEWRVDLNARGVRAVTPNQDSFVAWADYVGWSEDASVILFYQSDRLFQFVPKRGLDPGFGDVVRRFAADLPSR